MPGSGTHPITGQRVTRSMPCSLKNRCGTCTPSTVRRSCGRTSTAAPRPSPYGSLVSPTWVWLKCSERRGFQCGISSGSDLEKSEAQFFFQKSHYRVKLIWTSSVPFAQPLQAHPYRLLISWQAQPLASSAVKFAHRQLCSSVAFFWSKNPTTGKS